MIQQVLLHGRASEGQGDHAQAEPTVVGDQGRIRCAQRRTGVPLRAGTDDRDVLTLGNGDRVVVVVVIEGGVNKGARQG